MEVEKALLPAGSQWGLLEPTGQMHGYKALNSRPSSGDTMSFFSTSKGQAYERGSPIRRPLRDSEEDPLQVLLHNQGPKQAYKSPDRRPKFRPIDEADVWTKGANVRRVKGSPLRKAPDIRRSPVHRAAAEPRSAAHHSRTHPYNHPPNQSPARTGVNSHATGSKPQLHTPATDSWDSEQSLFGLWAHHPNPFSFFSYASTPKSASEAQHGTRSSLAANPTGSGHADPNTKPKISDLERSPVSVAAAPEQANPRCSVDARPQTAISFSGHPDASEESDEAFAWYFPSSKAWVGQAKAQLPKSTGAWTPPQRSEQQSIPVSPGVNTSQVLTPLSRGELGSAGGVGVGGPLYQLQSEMSLDTWRAKKDPSLDRWQARKGYAQASRNNGKGGDYLSMEQKEGIGRQADESAGSAGVDSGLGGVGGGEMRGLVAGSGRERRKSESASSNAWQSSRDSRRYGTSALFVPAGLQLEVMGAPLSFCKKRVSRNSFCVRSLRAPQYQYLRMLRGW
jgi:hypothetical protein